MTPPPVNISRTLTRARKLCPKPTKAMFLAEVVTSLPCSALEENVYLSTLANDTINPF